MISLPGFAEASAVAAAAARNSRRLSRSMIPVLTAHSIQVPDNSPIANRHLCYQFFGPFQSEPCRVHETEITLHHAQNRDISRRTDGKVPQLLMMDLPCRMPRRHFNYLVERHAQRKEL